MIIVQTAAGNLKHYFNNTSCNFEFFQFQFILKFEILISFRTFTLVRPARHNAKFIDDKAGSHGPVPFRPSDP